MESTLKSYTFRVVLEKDKWPDEPDEKAVWRIYVPALESRGAATWGHTREEALKNMQEVLHIVIEEMIQDGESLPSSALISESKEPLVTVTLG